MSKEFQLQPLLKGELVKLRPIKAADFDAVFKAASDPKIWEQHPEPNRYKKEVFQKYFDGALSSGGGFVIIDSKTQEIIGSSRYYGLDLTKSRVFIGYTFLRQEYWGRLYNRDLKKTMMTHAFQFVDKIHFEVGENNIRSRTAMGRIGGRLIGDVDLGGLKHVVFEITKQDFEKLYGVSGQ